MTSFSLLTDGGDRSRGTNAEKWDKRDRTPSEFHRAANLPRMKDIDIDMGVWDTNIRQLYALIEYTAQSDWARKPTTALRTIARNCGAHAVLVGYPWGDGVRNSGDDPDKMLWVGPIGFHIWAPDGQLIAERRAVPWSALARALEWIRNKYE